MELSCNSILLRTKRKENFMRKGLKNVSLILMGVLFSFSLIGCSNTEKKVSVDKIFEKTIEEKLNSITNPEGKDTKLLMSSNPYDWIKDTDSNKNYKYIVSQGEKSLHFMLSKFANSNKNGLEEYIMAIACAEILKENPTSKNWSSGREWYDNYTKTNNEVKIPVVNNDFNKIKSELSLLPKEYNSDIAVKDGCFVIVHGVLKSKRSVMDTFVSNSKSGKTSSITIVQYTDEGDALITKVVYSNHKYYGIDDGTRDAFASLENRIYTEFEYKYLKVFQEKNNTTYYLVNDDKLSSNDIWKSKISSDSKDFINCKFLCFYNNK